MGAGQSKDELLYQAVVNSNHEAVKTLRRDGAALEWLDKEGRTPLILACSRGDLYDMAITLLDEGAKLDAYRKGPHGGFPLHHAAKRGLDKTVLLLLSRGANPLTVNDEGLTPLDMARNKSHVSVVRIIEERICLFSGMVRELSGPGFLEVIVPQFVTKKVWVVVLPTESDPRKFPRNELVIYQNSRVGIPRTVISLTKAEVEEPRFYHHDPTLIITATDKSAKVRFKFMSENEGDKAQLERLYRACAQGIRQIESGPPAPPGLSPTQVATQGLQALMRPPAPQLSTATAPPNPPNPPSQLRPINAHSKPTAPTSSGPATPELRTGSLPPSEPIPDEIALAMAIDASLLSASAESVPVSPSTQPGSSSKRPSDAKNTDNGEFAGWVDGEQRNYGGWGSGSSAVAGPSRLGPLVADSPSRSESSKSGATNPAPSPSSSQSLTLLAPSSPPPAPSAPPLPLDGPIHYPSIDMSPVQVNYAPATEASEGPASKQKAEEKTGGQCVVCWDAPAEAVCIPCGHLSGCMDCLTEIKSKDWGCPVCRAPIQQVLKVYAV